MNREHNSVPISIVSLVLGRMAEPKICHVGADAYTLERTIVLVFETPFAKQIKMLGAEGYIC